MIRLLVHDAAWRSVSAAAGPLAGAVLPLVMDDAGVITADGVAVESGASAPDIAWLTSSLFYSGAMRPFMQELFKAPGLKWVQSAAAGFDHPMFQGIVQRGADLSTSHVHSEPIADYVLAGVLDHFQRGPERRAAQAQGEWKALTFREMWESRWLIVGFGSIGQAVARRARAFGAHVTGVRRNLAPHALADALVTLDDLPTALGSADVVVLSAPLNARTRGIADARFFGAMKPGSVLVNVGRGALVDEDELLAALNRGAPEHAVLDVFNTEPLPAESPLWTHPRVRVTAHTASETPTVDDRNAALFVDNLGRYVRGEPLLNVVDRAEVLGL